HRQRRERLVRQIDLGSGERVGDVVRLLGEADHPLVWKPLDVDRPAEWDAPGGGQAAFDDHLVRLAGDVATGDDGVTAGTGVPGIDYLRGAVLGVAGARGYVDVRDLLAQRERLQVGQRFDSLRDSRCALGVEADDDVR